MAALFILGYVNSCDSGAEGSVAKFQESTEARIIR